MVVKLARMWGVGVVAVALLQLGCGDGSRPNSSTGAGQHLSDTRAKPRGDANASTASRGSQAGPGTATVTARMPAKPNPSVLDGSSIEEQCRLLAPRIMPCLNHLLVASARALPNGDGIELSEVLAEELEEVDRKKGGLAPEAEARQAIDICTNAAIGSPAYSQRILACWDQIHCDAFATCMQRPPAP